SRPWLLLACFEHRLPARYLLLTPQLAEFTRPAVNRGVAHHRGQAQVFPVCRCFPEGMVRCLHHQLRRQPRTNSLALVQAQRLIQKVPITSCPVPIAPPPVGDRPNQRVQRSWLEVLQRQPTGPLTRQLFVQPLQQFPQGRLQELGALLAHVCLQSLEAPTIRRYSKDSAELLHKLGVHGRPHILSRSGALCEVSLFSRQVANPAWTASYPQKTLLYRRTVPRCARFRLRRPGLRPGIARSDICARSGAGHPRTLVKSDEKRRTVKRQHGRNSMTKQRTFVPEDLYRLVLVGDPQISPDGRSVAFVRSHVEGEKRELRSHIGRVPEPDAPPRPYTRGPRSDSQPRWSPDGRRLAFVRQTGEGPKADRQIWIIDGRGGEAYQLTQMRNGAASPVWSPDGRYLAFVSAVDDAWAEAAEKARDAADATTGRAADETTLRAADEFNPVKPKTEADR